LKNKKIQQELILEADSEEALLLDTDCDNGCDNYAVAAKFMFGQEHNTLEVLVVSSLLLEAPED
jgi:hypothetical protein